MVTVKGIILPEDRELVREFTFYTLQKFVRPSRLKKADIKIIGALASELEEDEREEFDEAGAWMTYDGIINERKRYTITINRNSIHRSGDVLHRMKDFIHMLAHELVHVKQYLNGEMFDYADLKRVRFHGIVYNSSTSKMMDKIYFESPWEIEAYGRATGLRDIFYVEKGWVD